MTQDDHDTCTAILYARWLADRDKMPLPPDGCDISTEWGLVLLRDGRHEQRIRQVTFHGERYSVGVHLPNWAHDPTPSRAPS